MGESTDRQGKLIAGALREVADRLRAQRRAAHARRVAWIFFEEKLEKVFSRVDSSGATASVLGRLYLTKGRDHAVGSLQRHVYKYNFMNTAQVAVGVSRLNVLSTVGNEGRVYEVLETGATLVFSQDLSGRIMVIFYPYRSQVSEVSEECVIVAFGKDPRWFTEERIARYLSSFVKYCEATSALSLYEFKPYVYRLFLRLKDIRNRAAQRTAVYFLSEKLLAIVAALVTVATAVQQL